MFKNRFILKNVIAIAICFAGMTLFSGCDPIESEDGNNDNTPTFGTLPATNGKFILTGADAYNGQYAYAQSTISTGSIYGGTGTIFEWKGIQIKNGTVELPVYYTSWSPVETFGYSGNDAIVVDVIEETKLYAFCLWIMPTAKVEGNIGKLDSHYIGWDIVQFTDGKCTKDVADGTYY